MIVIKRRYLIIGAGSVGMGMAALLHRSGEDVALCARGRSVEEIAGTDIWLTGALGDHRVPAGDIQVLDGLDRVRYDDFTAALVCVKSYDSATVAGHLARSAYPPSNTPIVLCQNGWGNTELFTAYLAPSQVFNASLVTGFEKHNKCCVNISVHARPIQIGSLCNSPVPSALLQALNAGGISAEASVDISRSMWDKMCFNCVVNPLSAIYNCVVGKLADEPKTRGLIAHLVKEIFTTMKSCGYASNHSSAASYLNHLFGTLLPATASHYTSMWHDLQNGRRTEIDALNGCICRLAGQAGILTPANRWITQAILARAVEVPGRSMAG